jgi:hypothetical protein
MLFMPSENTSVTAANFEGFQWFLSIIMVVSLSFFLPNKGIKHEEIHNTTHSQQACPGAHLASYTMGTGSFLWVKWPGHGINNPPWTSTRLKKEQSYISTFLCAFMNFSRVNTPVSIVDFSSLQNLLCCCTMKEYHHIADNL